jgi:rRNA-processing protein FCF1
MRIFLDANILFSAAKTAGAIRQLIDRVLDDGHECWVDEFVVTEARRNLRSKGSGSLPALETLLGRLRVESMHSAEASADTDWLPDKDRPVLAAAIRLRCDGLVTGDRTHFGAGYGKAFGGVRIHSPHSLAEELWRN